MFSLMGMQCCPNALVLGVPPVPVIQCNAFMQHDTVDRVSGRVAQHGQDRRDGGSLEKSGQRDVSASL